MEIKYYVLPFLKRVVLGVVIFGSWAINTVAAQNGRMVIGFNDNWEFKKGPGDFGKDTSYLNQDWEKIVVPHTYNRTDMQLDKNFYAGDAFYKKKFLVKNELKGKRIFLRFEGVGSVATIYINGRYLTEHKGSYAAFSFEITNSVRYGEENQILVKTNNEARKDVIPVNHFLFPIYGGIYRPVSMIVTSPVNITVTDYASPGIYVTQKNVSAKNADIHVKAKLENKEMKAQPVMLQTIVKDAAGKTVVQVRKNVLLNPQGATYVEQVFQVSRPHLWNGIRDPYLYSLTTSLIRDGQELDAVTQPLGIRRVELRAGDGVYLNGVKYPMYGVTRHQDRWQYGNALSHEQHEEDMKIIREMGATTIRLAHYQQAEDMYALADTMGLLIWAEIPFVNTTSLGETENARQQMTELVRQNRNHPSIYLWGLHNEVYSKTEDEHVPVLTRELNDIAKTDDPDRYTVAVSGYGEMDRPANLAADVQGMNRYYGWYEGRISDLEKWASGLETQYPGYKVMLSEYGADGNMDQASERLPDPSKINPVNGQFYPENYQTETHIRQWAIIEKHPYILASYLWNTFEFAVPLWNRGGVNARNLKGLVSFDRKRKKDAFYWYKANWNPEPMIYLANRRDSLRTQATTSVQAFSNLAQVHLFVNGKEVKGIHGVNQRHWIFENIALKKGNNKIEATGVSNGKILKDAMTWILQ
ncbi:glycoside hydrolase family 2 protein [Niabella sp. CC-SYL272]|uniref:glycoside hydrolase family 2 protein n=1 Tax=Niabella agricola TaxID=2891571 RepID=UPI001F1D15D2|nr:glycoside hydrolase family 2 protein [Niabella agricola]MCF3111585.1 glycoside hydrolase family 2 protein [Niabella agricola]